MKRRITLVVAATAAAVMAIGLTAAAGSSASTPRIDVKRVHLTTVASVKRYLRAKGIKTTGLVVQRGHRNYAGSHCPGKGWTCTKAKRVLQFASPSATGQNAYECSSSYGGPGSQPSSIPPVPTDVNTVSCVIVQVSASGSNTARCVIKSTLDPVTEFCAIHQENGTGANNAFVQQVASQQNDQQTQVANQQTYVEQFNGSGSNSLQSGQSIAQSSRASGVIAEQQTPDVFLSVTQNADTGTNTAHADQSVLDSQTALGNDATGFQYQNSNLTGSVFQNSVDVSTSTVNQSESLDQNASKAAQVDQTQSGPIRCCETQGTNTSDHGNLDQSSILNATSPFADQNTFLEGHCDSTGDCDVDQFGRVNGASQHNMCSGPFCDIIVECFSGGGDAPTTQAPDVGFCDTGGEAALSRYSKR
jgi:hypothetical protein